MEEGTKAAVSETVLEQQGEKQEEGGLLDKIRSLLGGSQKKEESQEHRRPQRMGKQQGKQRRKGQAGRRLPVKSRQKNLYPGRAGR